MLCLNRYNVFKKTKPKLYYFSLIFILSLSSIFAFFIIENFYFFIKTVPIILDIIIIIVFILCAASGVALAYYGFKPGENYHPKVSFKRWRRTDGNIARNYKLILLAGSIFILGGIISRIVDKTENLRIMGVIFCGISLIYSGIRGLVSKRAHGDVDAAAVDLSYDIGSLSRNKIYLSYINFNAGESEYKNGNKIFLVGADRIIMCTHQNGEWNSFEKPFEDIYSIGFYQDGAEVNIYIDFQDSSTFKVALDPTQIATTEPMTFIRSFLSLVDSWLEAPQGETISAAPHRRIVSTVKEIPAPADPISLVGQAQEAEFASTVIANALATPMTKARQLEI